VAATVRIGTCSWADESLVKHFYPSSVRTAEERLRYYADRFDTVEVDSTYYTIPARETVARWAERTPEDFVFHVKAFGLMTRHPVQAKQLPTDLREAMPLDDKGRVDRPPRPLRGEVFRRFLEALEPLREARKLGGILFQLPSYVVRKPVSYDYLTWAKEQLGDDRMLVEFRHRSWLEEEARPEVLGFLEELGATLVVVDAPKTEGKNLIPTVLALTSSVAYVRFHGRNAATWNARGGSAATRFDYFYPPEELADWVAPLAELAGGAEEAYAMFNNNNRGVPPGVSDPTQIEAQAAWNAEQLRSLLEEARVPVR
jgi:uncharacterized protein YecE (DUF72 family)